MILAKVNRRHSMTFTSFHKLITAISFVFVQLRMEVLLVLCLFIVCLLSFVIFKERKVAELKGQLVDALREGGTLSQQRDSLIRQRDRAYRQRDLAVSRLDRAEQRYRTLVWVLNLEPAPVAEEGEEDEGFASVEE